MVNGPVFQSKTAEKFLGSFKMLAKMTDQMEGTKTMVSTILQSANSALETVEIASTSIQSLGGAPNVDPLGETYFSVTPFRYGLVSSFAGSRLSWSNATYSIIEESRPRFRLVLFQLPQQIDLSTELNMSWVACTGIDDLPKAVFMSR